MKIEEYEDAFNYVKNSTNAEIDKVVQRSLNCNESKFLESLMLFDQVGAHNKICTILHIISEMKFT